MIKEFYVGKNLLITGATGFIGKVLVEKLLRDIPGINCIYLIIRSNDSTAKERFEDEIVSSRAFDRLRGQLGDAFYPFMQQKVVAISGDLSQYNIGLSSVDLDLLRNNVHVVIHCAASIDFRERLDKAIESNVLGTVRIFNLAKKFHHLQAFVHCSTAYVNCNRQGHIEETLPQLPFDAEEMVRYIMKHKVSQMDRLTDTLLSKYKYPNTYTFTKAISENILSIKRGGVPLVMVRPTIVGASYYEPVPGWVDSVAAIGAALLYVGVGVVRFMKVDGEAVTDIIPCDFVVNGLIAAAPIIAGKDTIEIYHIGSSASHPEKWVNIGKVVDEYWRHHAPKKAVAPPSVNVHSSSLLYEARFFSTYTVPSTLYSAYTMVFGNAKQRKDAERFQKLAKAARLINDTFSHFTANEWIFSVNHLMELWDTALPEKDRKEFFVDARIIHWKSYYETFCYGLAKYVLNEEGLKPPSEFLATDLITREDILGYKKNYVNWLFADVSWAVTAYKNPTQPPVTPQSTPQIKMAVLSSPTVRAVMEKVSREQNIPMKKLEARAHATYDQLAGQVTMSVVRFMAWFLKKLWRRIYKSIHVDEKGLERVREAIKKGPVVLIPTHRSYLDFLLMSFVFFAYDLPMPMIAAGEDFLGIFIVRWIFKNCGAFFLRRSFDGDALYWGIFSEFVEQLIINHQPVEFFIEGKRSRTGKSLHPKLGMLNMVVEPYLSHKVHDTYIVPISICYDKALEGELYTQEMLGQSKTKESLNGLFRASKVLRMNWGQIDIVYSPPISLKQYTESFVSRSLVTYVPPPALISTAAEAGLTPVTMPPDTHLDKTILRDPFQNVDHKKELLISLAYSIMRDLEKNMVIAPTAIVATTILMHRRGISRDELIAKSQWLCDEIEGKGAVVAFSGSPEAMVDNSLQLLRNLWNKNRNMYEPGHSIESGDSSSSSPPVPNSNYRKNILVLSYYRNQLLHLFQWEGALACVIAALTGLKQRKKRLPTPHPACECVGGAEEGVLVEEVKFLSSMWAKEFVYAPDINVTEVLDRFVGLGVLTRHTCTLDPAQSHAPSHTKTQRFYRISSRGEGMITFLCHLFWPFVESYFIACLTLFTVSPVEAIDANVLAQRMGWLGEKMYDEGKLNFYESCNTQVLANAISIFVHMGVLVPEKAQEDKKKKNGKKEANTAASRGPKPPPNYVLADSYVGKHGPLSELTKRIGKYRKTPSISTTKTSDLAMSLLEDFPLLAKL